MLEICVCITSSSDHYLQTAWSALSCSMTSYYPCSSSCTSSRSEAQVSYRTGYFGKILIFVPLSCSFFPVCGTVETHKRSSPPDAPQGSAGGGLPVHFVSGTCQDTGNKPEWDMRVWAAVVVQHNKGVVTRREEFPRDRPMFNYSLTTGEKEVTF